MMKKVLLCYNEIWFRQPNSQAKEDGKPEAGGPVLCGQACQDLNLEHAFPDGLFADQIHLIPQGYAQLAQILWENLQPRKYANFLYQNLALLLGFNLPQVEGILAGIVLPIGISFYTFQLIAYLIDVQRGKVSPCRLLPGFLGVYRVVSPGSRRPHHAGRGADSPGV